MESALTPRLITYILYCIMGHSYQVADFVKSIYEVYHHPISKFEFRLLLSDLLFITVLVVRQGFIMRCFSIL